MGRREGKGREGKGKESKWVDGYYVGTLGLK
jgi:hypothetical protein